MIGLGFRSRDSVTGQGIDGMYFGYLQTLIHRSQPGFIVSVPQYPGVNVRAGYYMEAKTHLDVSPGESVIFYFIIYLMTVTANAISNESNLVFGYLCPEDYLSVKGFEL